MSSLQDGASWCLRPRVQAVADHADSWPFREPVDPALVSDYYDVILNPIGQCTRAGCVVVVVGLLLLNCYRSHLVAVPFKVRGLVFVNVCQLRPHTETFRSVQSL